MKPRFLSTKQIEDEANTVLDLFEQDMGSPLVAPVPVELIAEFLDLGILWDVLPDAREGVNLSRFCQPTPQTEAVIILNKAVLDSHFGRYPGLERTALAHEIGHARLHLESSRRQQLSLINLQQIDSPTISRSTQAKTLTDATLLDQMIHARGPESDDWWREWQAHTFMRFLLIPSRLLDPLLAKGFSPSWSGDDGLYQLRRHFDVTISALTVHLSKLNVVEVDGRRIRRPKAVLQPLY